MWILPQDLRREVWLGMKRTVLVVSEQSALRGNIAQLLQSMVMTVEVAAGEKRAREILAAGRIRTAVVAADSLDRTKPAFARALASRLRRVIVLADTQAEMRWLAEVVPEAHFVRGDPLDQRRLLELLVEPRPADPAVPEPAAPLHFEGRTLDFAGRTLVAPDGQEVGLTHAEFELLAALASHPGRVLSRDQLRDALGGRRADAYDRSIDMLVARLRRKIEPLHDKPRFIVTVPGVGYKFSTRTRRSDSPAGPSGAPPAESPRPERRQLTILACEVTGLSEAAARLDPEDLQAVTRLVHEACRELVARRGGVICRELADELLVCFGYPEAHEDDAQRAVQTALDLVRVIADLKPPFAVALGLRAGLSTGLAVVGRLDEAGLGAAGLGVGGTLVGEPLDVAMKLRSQAKAGRVVVAASTHELAGRFFKYRALPARRRELGRLWEVLGKAATLDRFGALRRQRSASFVGRGDELDRLARIWAKVRGGAGQAVLLCGDAGIGKSRLAAEILRRIESDRPAVIRLFGSPHHVAAPLAPLVHELELACGFKPGDGPGQRLKKLGRLLDAQGARGRTGQLLLAELLGLPAQQPASISQLSPLKRKAQTLAAFVERVADLAAAGPVCLVVEDAQWFDATSLEFLYLLVERLARLPILLLLTARPDFVPAWSDHPSATALILTRLSARESAVLARRVANRHAIAAEVVDEIVTRSDGVPLFVEELTKAVLDARSSAGAVLRPSKARPAIPKTLHASLLERLDRLGSAREVAQVAAAIGREFSHELLRAVAPASEGELRTALDQLVVSGLVVRRGTPPLAIYSFKHALIRDAAHDMLIRTTRRQVHARIVATLEERSGETVTAEPGLLAYHCREAGNIGKAVGYLLQASDRALSRAATTEVLAQLKQALELLSALPEGSDRWNLELSLQIALGRAGIAAHGYAARVTRDAFGRARVLCERLDDPVWPPVALLGEWAGAWWSGDQATALDRAQHMLDWGRARNKPATRAIAHMAAGMSLTVRSSFAEACGHLERALAIDQFAVPGLQPFIASDIDGRIQCLSYLHDCSFLLGRLERAAGAMRAALADWPTALYSLALAQTTLCRMYTVARNAAEAVKVSAKLMKLTEGQGYPFFGVLCQIYRGWALANTGNVAGGLALCRSGVARLRATGTTCGLPGYLALLAECHLIAGDAPGGLQAVADAVAIAEQTDGRERLAEAHRLKGKLLLLGDARGNAAAAAACFRLAIMVAQGQAAQIYELRAARELATLFAAHGRNAEARAVLAPVFDAFTEGLDCLDLREARDLLDQIDDLDLSVHSSTQASAATAPLGDTS
jgi:DNA-binding response OmpR family regulator/predicted ATPase